MSGGPLSAIKVLKGEQTPLDTPPTIAGNYYFPNGFRQNAHVQLKGRKLPHAVSFHIRFRKGPKDGDDIALDFNPSSDGPFVVMKSFEGGAWTKEEIVRENISPFFSHVKDFTLDFIVRAEYYEIKLNGKDFAHFDHRIAPKLVQYFQLGEGVEYSQCDIKNNE